MSTSVLPTLKANPMRTLLELAGKEGLTPDDRHTALTLFDNATEQAFGYFDREETPTEDLYGGDGWILYKAIYNLVTNQGVGKEVHALCEPTRTRVYEVLSTMIRDKHLAGDRQHSIGEHALLGTVAVPLHLRVHALAKVLQEKADTEWGCKAVLLGVRLQDQFTKEHHIKSYPGLVQNHYCLKRPLLSPPSDDEQNHAIANPHSPASHGVKPRSTVSIGEECTGLYQVLAGLLNNRPVDDKWWDKVSGPIKAKVYEHVASLIGNKDVAGAQQSYIGELAFLGKGFTIPAHFRVHAVAAALERQISKYKQVVTECVSAELLLAHLKEAIATGTYSRILGERKTLDYSIEDWEKNAPLSRI